MDVSAIIIAIIAAIPPTLVALLSLRKANQNGAQIIEVKHELNSRLTQLLEAREQLQHAAGVAQERGEQREREAMAEPIVTVANLPGTDLPDDSRPDPQAQAVP